MEKYNTENTPQPAVCETTTEYLSEKDQVSCTIMEHIGTLRTSSSGWSRELNIVAWNGGKAKFDIRDWSEDHSKMSKGITMTDNEMKRIYDWISARGTAISTAQPAEEAAEEAAKN